MFYMNFYDSNSGLLQNMYEKCDWECVSYQTFYQPNYGNILHLLLLVRIKDQIKLMIVGNNFEKKLFVLDVLKRILKETKFEK